MYLHIHIHIYIHMCVYIYIYAYINICIHRYIYIHRFIYYEYCVWYVCIYVIFSQFAVIVCTKNVFMLCCSLWVCVVYSHIPATVRICVVNEFNAYVYVYLWNVMYMYVAKSRLIFSILYVFLTNTESHMYICGLSGVSMACYTCIYWMSVCTYLCGKSIWRIYIRISMEWYVCLTSKESIWSICICTSMESKWSICICTSMESIWSICICTSMECHVHLWRIICTSMDCHAYKNMTCMYTYIYGVLSLPLWNVMHIWICPVCTRISM